MNFKPNYFTCIAHLYLYYTLLVPHTYASYIRHWCIFFHWEIQYNFPVFLTWYQSHCSDLFLSSLVFIGVTPFSTSLPPSQQSLQPLAVEPLTSSSCCLRVLDLQSLSLRSPHCIDNCTYRHRRWYCSNYICRGITKIVFSRSTRQWKPRSNQSLHAPSRATQRFCISASRAPRADELLQVPPRVEYSLHAPPRAGYCLHAPPRARPALADVSPRWRHHHHVSWRHHWLWPLTFSRVDFCNLGAPYPVFCVDFIFAVYFCIFCF